MSDAFDELTVDWEEDGELKVKQLDRQILSKGAWSTVMFLYQEMDPQTKEYRAPKVSIRRYRKQNDRYALQSKFNLSSEAQAREITEVLQRWFKM